MHIVDEGLNAFFLHHDPGEITVIIFLQFFGHGIKGLRQFTKFIVALKVYPLGIFLFGNLADTFGQFPDRIGNASGKIDEKDKGDHKA